MQFGNLNGFWLMALPPLLGVFYAWAFKRRRTLLFRFADASLAGGLVRSVSVAKRVIKAGLMVLALFFMVLTLTEPKWGFHWENVKRRGLDMVVALDLSKSMAAEDAKPNRLEAAKREVKSLIHVMTGDRIGIVAFAGSAFLQCPLTLDYGTAKLFVDALDLDTVPLGGTDIGGAIRTAVKAFEGYEKKYRVLILITDGEDHQDRVMEAVEEAKQQGVIIFPVEVGRPEGAPIPTADENGQQTFVKDAAGQVVLSKANAVLLEKIALLTGGRKGRIGTGQFPLEEIYKSEVARMEKRELESSRQKRYEHRFQGFLLMAFMALVAEGLLSERKGRIESGVPA